MSPSPRSLLPVAQISSQSQRLSWAKIFLNVSLALIAYTRRLIPWQTSCFRKRYVEQIINAATCAPQDFYASFCALDFPHAHTSQELRVLVRGSHEYADQILATLENGIFDALKRGRLQSLEMSLITTTAAPHATLETHPFDFEYHDGHISSIRAGLTNNTFVVETFGKGFRVAIRALLRALRDLQPLPASLTDLGVSLTYSERRSILHQPSAPVALEALPVNENTMPIAGHSPSNPVATTGAGQPESNVDSGFQGGIAGSISIDVPDRAVSNQLRTMQQPTFVQNTDIPSTLEDAVEAAILVY